MIAQHRLRIDASQQSNHAIGIRALMTRSPTGIQAILRRVVATDLEQFLEFGSAAVNVTDEDSSHRPLFAA